jgi:hypothetical protein
VAGINEAPRHHLAHAAKPDESDFHCVSPDFLKRGIAGPSPLIPAQAGIQTEQPFSKSDKGLARLTALTIGVEPKGLFRAVANP